MGMQVGGGSGGAGQDLNSEINVTPFVDVMLVLLVIFMITAPMMTTGVDIDLPETVATELEDTEGKLILSIDRTNHLYLGATPVRWADLGVKLSTNQRVKAEKTLWIDADKDIAYGIVVTAMAQARASGVSKLMMLTDPAAQLDIAELDKKVGIAKSPDAADEGTR